MCQHCGCRQYIEQGKETILKRSAEIVKELALTAQNVADYEDTELISSLIAPFGSRGDEVFRAAAWISGLHAGARQADREPQYQSHVRAFRDIFSRLPARGDPGSIASTYHQLEQLNHELDDADLASLDRQTGEALRALRHVHENPAARRERVKKQYKL